MKEPLSGASPEKQPRSEGGVMKFMEELQLKPRPIIREEVYLYLRQKILTGAIGANWPVWSRSSGRPT